MSDDLDVTFAGEALIPRIGGAERFALELLGGLAPRHRVTALVLGRAREVAEWRAYAGAAVEVVGVDPPPQTGGAWEQRLHRAARVRDAVGERARESGEGGVVVGQLYAGAGAVVGARDAGVPATLLLAGYEALCHWAFAPDSRCRPASRCRRCPRARALPPRERQALLRVRDEQDRALSAAAALIAPSATVAAACERVSGRAPLVANPVTAAPPVASPDPHGHVLLVSSVWSPGKGAELLAPLARALPERTLLVQAPNGVPAPERLELAELPNVDLRESASEIGPLLEGAAALLVPSQHAEPFGRVAFEGMAAGVPTLASATGGLAEFVPAAQLVAEYGDAVAWGRAVRDLDAPGAWQAARERGRQAAEHVLSRDPVGNIEAALCAVTARRPEASVVP